MSVAHIPPSLWPILASGAYFLATPFVDPRTLVVPPRPPRAPKPWHPSIYDDKLGVVAERPAAVLRGGA